MTDLRLPDLAAALWANGAPREDLASRVGGVLRAEIETRRLPAGTRLPSEADLAKLLKVSRPTLREATRVLAREGLLDIRHGVGTFVTGGLPPLRNALDTMSSLTSAIRAAGGQPGVTSLVIAEVEAPHGVAEALRVPAKQRVACISRVRLSDGKPLGLASEYLPLSPAVPFATLQTFGGGSLYQFLSDTLAVVLVRSEMSVMAVAATAAQARLLDVRPGAPLLLMRETHVGPEDRRVLYSVNHHNSAVIDLTLARVGLRA